MKSIEREMATPDSLLLASSKWGQIANQAYKFDECTARNMGLA